MLCPGFCFFAHGSLWEALLDVRFMVGYYCHVLLDENMYVYEWFRWSVKLQEVKEKELEEVRKRGR